MVLCQWNNICCHFTLTRGFQNVTNTKQKCTVPSFLLHYHSSVNSNWPAHTTQFQEIYSSGRVRITVKLPPRYPLPCWLSSIWPQVANWCYSFNQNSQVHFLVNNNCLHTHTPASPAISHGNHSRVNIRFFAQNVRADFYTGSTITWEYTVCNAY